MILFFYMFDWKTLIEIKKTHIKNTPPLLHNWREEAAYSICEAYYLQFKTQRLNNNQRIDFRPGSDFSRFMETYVPALTKHNVWIALFPNKISSSSAYALDEALNLLADSKIIDRIYSGDIVTVQKLVSTIRKKRMKYIDL